MNWAVYKPSKRYSDREDVPDTETPEMLDEESKFNYTDYENKYGKSGTGIEYTKYTRVIETNAPILFRANDFVKFDNETTLKIKDVEIIIPDDKKKSVSFWGNELKRLMAKKRIALQ